MKSTIYSVQSTREYVKQIFDAKQKQSKGFSLRQFAKKMDVSVGALSNFISGKRAISSEFLLKFCDRMNLNSEEIAHLLALHVIEPDHSTASDRLRAELEARILATQKKEIASLESESLFDWKSIVLIEATRTKLLDPEKISAFADQVQLSLTGLEDRLKRLTGMGLLAREAGGKLKKTHGNFQFVGDKGTSVLKEYTLQWMDISKNKIKFSQPEDRYLATETVALSKAKLPEARVIINRCLDELAALAAQDASPDSVFHCGVQMVEAVGPKDAKGVKR